MRNCCCCNPTASDVYSNSATMLDGAGNPDFPATLQPYDLCGEGSTGGCGIPSPRNCGGADQPPCGSSGGPSVIGSNDYSPTGDQQIYTGPCRKTGWKNVQARATWPGVFGFINTGLSCCPTDSPPQAKYKSIHHDESYYYSINSTYSGPLGSTNRTFTSSGIWNQTATVDNYGNLNRSGNVSSAKSLTGASIPGDDYDLSESCTGCFAGTESDDIYTDPEAAPNNIVPGMPAFASNLSAGCGVINYGGHSGTAAEMTALNLFYCGGNYSYSDAFGTRTIIVTNADNGTFRLSDDSVGFTVSGNIVDTRTTIDGSVYVDYYNWAWSCTISLSNTYSYAQVQEEIATLLNQWNLSDDAVYPWRTDGQTWKAPVVSRDAASIGPAISFAVVAQPDDCGGSTRADGLAIDCNFINEGSYTGAIFGGPNPAGYDRFWDYRAKVTQVCCPPGLVIQENNWFCTPGWGAYSTSPIPASATQWTNNEDGSLMMEGAWLLQWNGADYIWAQKWAESLEEWPSVNYARPFGRDRFLVDYDNVTGIAECYGTTGIPTADYAGDIVTDSGDPLYAFRRFPSCRPIGSTIIISSAAQSGPGVITITTAETHWILPGDSLDFYGVSGLATNVLAASATPGTDTFTVSGTLIGSYTGGGYVASHNTAFDTWKWDWTCSRHTFVVQQWQTDYRGSGSVLYNQYQASLQLAAKTSVIYFSPNAESFSNGYSAGFGSIAYEPCFDKSQWHGKFLQATADPFFKAPLQCPGDTGSEHFCQQSAPCAADTDTNCVYYQYPALVEPMIVPPEGSPPLPVAFSSFDGGMPGKAGVNCADPKDIPTIHAIRQAWLDCHDWETVVHKHCISSVDPSTISASRGAGNSIGAGGGSTGL